jgi:hypothetical protein
MLLDLDEGWMRVNGKQFGPGISSGVTGPLMKAVEMGGWWDAATVLPCVTPPEGTTGTDVPFERLSDLRFRCGRAPAATSEHLCSSMGLQLRAFSACPAFNL